MVSALLLMVIISMAIALIGYLTISSIQVGGTLKTYKTTKEAAESVAYSVINEIDSDNLTTENCTVGCSPNEKGCQIKLPPDIENIIKTSGFSYNATLLRNCTDDYGNQIYTIRVEVNKSNGTKSVIYFIYRK